MKNAVEPNDDQINAFLAMGDAPVYMVNLLKFREKANYPDGRDADISGREAYFRYAEPMTRLVLAAGGSLDFSGDVGGLLIGELDENWDMVAIMTYPSPKTLVDISLTPEFQEIAVHRKAGLEGQLLLPCRVPGR
ncbi:hypothetical protein V0U79_12510 [Hyphobacterium sp. HN65]|uniref:DUF1330 domain-containing protein n=1 Tax=Hyphobacterium lacteum TaxID=3116575 RepID=A0ABU7LU98_9PROT|nr:hypothetical protein [Hyphobacterium sp. HN65]MEE2527191.1 hypothetical protein [Hyphobacterium sp. HN65]